MAIGRSCSASFEQSGRAGYDPKHSESGCNPYRVCHDHPGFPRRALAVYQRRRKATRSGAKLQAKRDRDRLRAARIAQLRRPNNRLDWLASG